MNKPRISQEISQQLISSIKSGKFAPGTKLPSEMDLSKTFDVSRSTIREALSVLNAMGIISTRQGGGSFVEEFDVSSLKAPFQIEPSDIKQIRYLLEVRTILETEAAYLAALRRTNEDLKRIAQALQHLQYDFSSEDQTGQESDISFHREMIRAAHNPIMIYTMDNLSNYYAQSLSITLKQNMGLKRKRQQVYKEHEVIYLAIEAGEPELARVQCAIHLKNAEKKLALIK